MINFRLFLVFLFGVLTIPTSAQRKNNEALCLWYNKPASLWEEALPLGNGETGAMVFGGLQRERYQLNDHTLWSGGPQSGNNSKATALLPVLREHIFQGNYGAAEAAWRKMQGPYSARFLPLGDLWLDFGDFDTLHVKEYRRELDLQHAVTSITYQSNGVTYTRTSFTSHPDRVMTVRMKANKKRSLFLNIGLTSKLHYSTKIEGSRLLMEGRAPFYVAARDYFPEQLVYDDEESMRFYVGLSWDVKGGQIVERDSTVQIRGADEITLYLAESTSFNGFDKSPGSQGKDARKLVDERLSAAFDKGYDALYEDHLSDYESLFNRVVFRLENEKDYSDLPTDVRLKRFAAQTDDLSLQTLYYQFGRYLLISSSRLGSRPANLQGIWNDHIQPPWGSNYTININTQMNYWLAENTNLSECHQPLLDFIEELSINGAKTANVNYGIQEGWMAHHNTDLWAKTSPVGNYDKDTSYFPSAFCWQMGGAWLSTHLWEHFLYTQDTIFLQRKAFPLMQGAAKFLMHWLVEDPINGYLVTAPSTSPENAFTKNDHKHYIGKATTMDMAITRELLQNTLEASKILQIDSGFAKAIEEILLKLYPYHVGRYGQIQEWDEDLDDPKDTHRHVSQLFGLFPGTQIDSEKTKDLADAARITLIHRGDVSTGWSMAWKINWWARLGDGEHAHKILISAFNYIDPNGKITNKMSGGGTYPNLFDAHPPFQIDGNFGATAGITEMLMQSHNGRIVLLPALPKVWQGGKINGIKARGNFELDLTWKLGKLTLVHLTSIAGKPCQIESKVRLKVRELPTSEQKSIGNSLRFNTKKGKKYTLVPIDND